MNRLLFFVVAGRGTGVGRCGDWEGQEDWLEDEESIECISNNDISAGYLTVLLVGIWDWGSYIIVSQTPLLIGPTLYIFGCRHRWPSSTSDPCPPAPKSPESHHQSRGSCIWSFPSISSRSVGRLTISSLSSVSS